MSRCSSPKRGRGRPRRQYRIRVVGERREQPDYEKLARALLEHAAMEQRERGTSDGSSITEPEPDVLSDVGSEEGDA
ncbi:hypothetical protein SAMN05880568_2800 [Microbacterium sp. RURRCA19A]|nr:hypothetical protein SAMN05880568_2800 [Microbacterium sp. RURRCA19A]